MDREAMGFEDPDEEVSELEMLLTSLRHGPHALPRTTPRRERRELEMLLTFLYLTRPQPSAPPSAATRRPRTRTRIRSRRSSRLARPYTPRASAPVGLPAPGLEDLLTAVDNVDQAQPPEATRSQEQEPEFEFVMPPPPSIDHIRHAVPSSAGAIVPSTRPPTPVRRDTAMPRPRVVKFRSACWVWIVLSRPPKEPVPPCDFNSSK